MRRISVWSIAIATLILLSIGFIFVGAIGLSMSPEWLSAQQIRDQARKAIPEPYPTRLPPQASRWLSKTRVRSVPRCRM